jgi:hypothetical protein
VADIFLLILTPENYIPEKTHQFRCLESATLIC